MVGHHDNHFHLWKEIHKDVVHQLNELQKVERWVEVIEWKVSGLSIQMDGVEVWVAEQKVLGNRVLRLVLWCVGAIHH